MATQQSQQSRQQTQWTKRSPSGLSRDAAAGRAAGSPAETELTVLPITAVRAEPLLARLAGGLTARLRAGARRRPTRRPAAGTVAVRGRKHGAAPASPPPPPVLPPAPVVVPPAAPRAPRRPVEDAVAAAARAVVLLDPCCGEWRAWREPGATLDRTVLRVSGSLTLPPGAVASRVVLQEAVLSGNCQYGAVGGAGSSVLLLEPVIVPPPFGATDSAPGAAPRAARAVLVSYRREEPRGGTDFGGLPVPPRHTHVTILPDGVTLPIRDL